MHRAILPLPLRPLRAFFAGLCLLVSARAQESANWTVTTAAGAVGQFSSTDGAGSAARFNNPRGLAVDGSGQVLIADTFNHTIRRMTAEGQVTTIAGSAGLSGSTNGVGSAARFNSPAGVAIDSTGIIYVADTLNHAIRKIAADGTVTTYAGVPGTPGVDDGQRLTARFREPVGVAVDGAGNVYVADTGNSTLRRISAAGAVTTLAGAAGQPGRTDGTGSEARFDSPYGVTVDSTGTVYVADTFNHAVRRVTTTGAVSTVAGVLGSSGETDGVGAAARFSGPTALAFGPGGKLYVSETHHVVRMISPGDLVQRIAGSPGVDGSADGPGYSARFNAPAGIAVSAAGILHVSDTLNSTVRKLVRSEPQNPNPPPPNPATRIVNISTRAYVGTGGNVMIAGFVITGSAPKQVLIRANGPILAGFGVPGALSDPHLKLHAPTFTATNDNWAEDEDRIEAAAARVGAFAWPRGSKDAAMLVTLAPGSYTAEVGGVQGGTGAALVEVYDADQTPGDAKLVNISTRSEVRTDGDIQIAGFVITGPTAKRVLIRANGPALSAWLGGVLADPELALWKGDTMIAENDDWGADQATVQSAAASAGAFAWSAGSKDAALVITLQPGNYTAQVRGKNRGTGVALIEVYALD